MASIKRTAGWMMVLGLLGSMAYGDDILPKTPEGWKYERIDFPLSFAPDLVYKGFEELRFAPGMFNAKSDTYFTYVFGMKLTGSYRVDAAFLKGLLTSYYRGLCRTVWGDETPKPDFSSINVEITTGDLRDGVKHFKATIHMIDAFVTRKPLVLNLTIQANSDEADKHTLISAQASPKPDHHTIWKLLRSLAVGATTSTPQKPLGNDG